MSRFFITVLLSLIISMTYSSVHSDQLNVPSGCILKCKNQFIFLSQVSPKTQLKEFEKVFGFSSAEYDSGEGSKLTIFRGVDYLVGVIFTGNILDSVGTLGYREGSSGINIGTKSEFMVVPGSNGTLVVDWSWSKAKDKCRNDFYGKHGLGAAFGTIQLSGKCKETGQSFNYFRLGGWGETPELTMVFAGSGKPVRYLDSTLGAERGDEWLLHCMINQAGC